MRNGVIPHATESTTMHGDGYSVGHGEKNTIQSVLASPLRLSMPRMAYEEKKHGYAPKKNS